MQTVLNQRSDRYRRTARRIRGLHNGKPGELYRSLRDLSERYDSSYSAPAETVALPAATPADDFAAMIVERIRNGVLSYSDRLELLGHAETLGIGRFDANLIIAGVQHRHAARGVHEVVLSERKSRVMDLVMAFLLVQVFILFVAWAVLR